MNQTTHPDDVPLAGHRLADMGPATRPRVLDAARSAWNETPSPEVSWGMPVLRLAACLLLSAMMVIAAKRMEATPTPLQSGWKLESLPDGEPMSVHDAVRRAVAASDELRRFCSAYMERQRLLHLGIGAMQVEEND